MKQLLSTVTSMALFYSSQAAFAESCPQGTVQGEVNSRSFYYAALSGDGGFTKCSTSFPDVGDAFLECGDIYIKVWRHKVNFWKNQSVELRAKDGNFYEFYSDYRDTIPHIKRFGVNPLDKSIETKYIKEKQVILKEDVYDRAYYSELLPDKLLQVKQINQFAKPCKSVSF